MPVYKPGGVVLVVGHVEAAGLVLLDFQAKTVFIIIITVVFACVLGKIMNGTISVRVFQISGFIVRFRVVSQFLFYNPLHDVQLYAGTHMHVQAHGHTAIIIGVGILLEIGGIIYHLQGEGIYGGRVRRQFLHHGQLPGVVGNIRRPRVSHTKPLVAVIRFQAVCIAVNRKKRNLTVIGKPRAILAVGV